MNKKQIILEWAGAEDRSGTVEAQIGLITERVRSIAAHITKNHKDYSSKRGLTKLVGHRHRLLRYLADHKPDVAKVLQKKIKG